MYSLFTNIKKMLILNMEEEKKKTGNFWTLFKKMNKYLFGFRINLGISNLI